MNSSIYLFEFLSEQATEDVGMWKEMLEKRLDAIGFDYERIGNRLRIWDSRVAMKKTARSDVGYRDGVEIFKVSMPKQYERPVIGFNFSRLYFCDKESHPAYQSAKELFKNYEFPTVLRQLPLFALLDKLIIKINELEVLFRPLQDIDWKCVSPNVAIDASRESTNVYNLSEQQYASAILALVRKQHALHPISFEMVLIDTFTTNKQKATEVASKTSQVLVNDWHCSISKKRISTKDDFEAWINSENGARVGFFALDTKKGERPPQAAIEWMRSMEEAKIPYSLFSAAPEVNPIYTRHGNAMHLLTKAGGFHFQVNALSIPDYQDHWFIGLDLGYGSQYKGKCVVVSLTDSNGDLKCFWRAVKNLDETLNQEILQEAITWIVGQADTFKPGLKFVVIRDGKCPHRETIDNYKKILPPGRSLFLEYTKTHNPVMIDGKVQPDPGTIAIPKYSAEAFLFTAKASQKNMLTATTRFRPKINDLGYSLEQIGEILTALCFSSKLSFQPSSLPAPIYWADGIASLSNINLQFAGWGHLPKAC